MPRLRGNDEEPQGDDRFLDEGSDDPRSPQKGGELETGFDDEDDRFDDEDEQLGEEPDEAPGESGLLGQRPARRPAQDDHDDRERELVRLRTENEVLRRTPVQPSPPTYPQEETEDAFARRIAALEPYEQLAERQARAERRHAQSLAYIQASTADQLDKAAFSARAASDRRFAKYADEVERRHQQLLIGGPQQPPQLVPRETILKVLLGEKLLAPVNREQRRQQERHQRKLDNQRVRPGSSRGDVGSSRERRSGAVNEREARRQRLENVEI